LIKYICNHANTDFCIKVEKVIKSKPLFKECEHKFPHEYKNPGCKKSECYNPNIKEYIIVKCVPVLEDFFKEEEFII
jgi:hypothetical protein